jgi:hypothetical protein
VGTGAAEEVPLAFKILVLLSLPKLVFSFNVPVLAKADVLAALPCDEPVTLRLPSVVFSFAVVVRAEVSVAVAGVFERESGNDVDNGCGTGMRPLALNPPLAEMIEFSIEKNAETSFWAAVGRAVMKTGGEVRTSRAGPVSVK